MERKYVKGDKMGLDQFILIDSESEEYEYHIVISWRKRNQIHGYFDRLFDEVENCEAYPVSIEQLEKLIDTCRKVLENHDLAEELLPVTGGIFFGNYEYNDLYFNQVEETMENLENLIKIHDGKTQYYYYAWW
jgi:hypothetical protein